MNCIAMLYYVFDVRPQSEFIRTTGKWGGSKTQRQAINSEKRKIKNITAKDETVQKLSMVWVLLLGKIKSWIYTLYTYKVLSKQKMVINNVYEIFLK